MTSERIGHISEVSGLFQITAIPIAFLAVAVFAVAVFRTPKPTWFLHFFGLGMTLNALQKLTLKLSKSESWHLVVLLDHSLLPWLEALAYALGAVFFLVRMRSAEAEFQTRVKEVLNR